MAGLQLGAAPDRLDLTLVKGADFIAGLDSLDGNWPGTAVIALVFNDPDETTWTATITAAAADWNVDKAAVGALIGAFGNHPKARLLYTDGTTGLVWAQGTVTIRASI